MLLGSTSRSPLLGGMRSLGSTSSITGSARVIGLRADSGRGHIDAGAAAVGMAEVRSQAHGIEGGTLIGLAADPVQSIVGKRHCCGAIGFGLLY